jgi:hypothetical protein
MPVEYMIALCGGAIITMIGSMKVVDRSLRLQQDILVRGILAQATVTHLWRPPAVLRGVFARISFEFRPGGAEHPIRTCHVDRRGGEWAASLPQIGANVAVRYLPEKPSQAVIVKLVSRSAK